MEFSCAKTRCLMGGDGALLCAMEPGHTGMKCSYGAGSKNASSPNTLAGCRSFLLLRKAFIRRAWLGSTGACEDWLLQHRVLGAPLEPSYAAVVDVASPETQAVR